MFCYKRSMICGLRILTWVPGWFAGVGLEAESLKQVEKDGFENYLC